jgi:3-isopropylmalate/(R)-2-methylmalate dehydratase small subunit
LPEQTVTALADVIEADPQTSVTVDLAEREVRAAPPGGGPVLRAPIEIDDHTRWRLMEGLDDISLTLRHAEEIARYERDRPEWLRVAG